MSAAAGAAAASSHLGALALVDPAVSLMPMAAMLVLLAGVVGLAAAA